MVWCCAADGRLSSIEHLPLRLTSLAHRRVRISTSFLLRLHHPHLLPGTSRVAYVPGSAAAALDKATKE